MKNKFKAWSPNLENVAEFCRACGRADFIINNQTPNQPWQPTIPQNQSKKKKTGLIIGIIAAFLFMLAGIGMVAEKVNDSMNELPNYWEGAAYDKAATTYIDEYQTLLTKTVPDSVDNFKQFINGCKDTIIDIDTQLSGQ